MTACASTLEAEDYETSCTNDSECVAVLVGDMCDCSCNEGAINVVDLPSYNEDRADIECGVDCGPCPELSAAVCLQRTCQLAAP